MIYHLLQLELFCVSALIGLIWIVQLVHYPSFLYVAPEKFPAFEKFHQSAISLVVMPLMLCEVFASGSLFLLNQTYLTFFSFLMVILIWISTFFLSVPLHIRLSVAYEEDTVRKLVLTNWPRTLLWSLRGMLLWSLHLELIG